MAKRIERDGKFYRIRRGKEVEIPDQWVGKTVHSQELRSRKSRRTRQQRDAEAPTDEELRRRADGRSTTPIDDDSDDEDPSAWDAPEEISQSEAEADADAYTPYDNAYDDDFSGVIGFCDCENCAE